MLPFVVKQPPLRRSPYWAVPGRPRHRPYPSSTDTAQMPHQILHGRRRSRHLAPNYRVTLDKLPDLDWTSDPGDPADLEDTADPGRHNHPRPEPNQAHDRQRAVPLATCRSGTVGLGQRTRVSAAAGP